MRYGDGFNLGVTMTEDGVQFTVDGYPVLTAEMSADELIDMIRDAAPYGQED